MQAEKDTRRVIQGRLAGIGTPPMTRVISLVLFAVATAAYFFRWDTAPSGYYTDAASNVLNALCIRHTGADEYGRFLPISIRAFDDYRPPLLIYLFSLSSLFHPLTTQSARLISMSLGWATLLLFFTVYKNRFPLPSIRYAIFYPLLFGLVLTSPWVFMAHRMPVEYVTTIPVTLFLLLASWRWIQEPDSHSAALTAAFATGLMLYAYIGTKPLAFTQVPLLFALHILHNRRLPKTVLSFLFVWLLMAAPSLIDLLGEQTNLARYRTVSPAGPVDIIKTFFQHIGPDFLFFTGDYNRRHHTGFGGMLNIALLPLLILGGLTLFKEVFLRKNSFWIFIALFLATALLPVSLTREGLPHALRTLTMVIPLVMVMAMGFSTFEGIIGDRHRIGAIVLIGLLFFGCWRSYQSLEYYHRIAAGEAYYSQITEGEEQGLWTYYPQSYTLPQTLVSPFDHTAESINERYERVALEEDWIYCCGENNAVQALAKAVKSSATEDLDTPGTRAFDYRKLFALALTRSDKQTEALTAIRQIYAIETNPGPDSNDLELHRHWSEITLIIAEEANVLGDTAKAQLYYRESSAAIKRLTNWGSPP